MESNNNNNNNNDDTTLAIQADKIFEAIRNEDFTAISNIIQKNPSPGSIYMILDTLFEELKSPKMPQFCEFCFTIFEQFIIHFGIPIVLWINNPAIAQVLDDLLSKDSTPTRVNELLTLCLEMLSFDKNLSHIPNLVDLWKKVNSRMAFPVRTQKLTSFAVLYSKKQRVIGDSEKLAELSPFRQKELPGKIEKLLETEDFESSRFNFLEKDLAIYYYNELVRLLDIFENLEGEQESEIKEKEEVPVAVEEVYPKEIRFRTSFFLYEKLEEDEGMETEYKKYSWEFNEMIDGVLSKTICGFLNRFGGRLYIGVDDNGSVVGIKLTGKQRDEAKLHVLGLMNAFEPSNINTSNLVEIVYLPIKNPVNNQKIPGLFIMKIIVKQGDFSKLYSVSKELSQFYQRNDAQTVLLRPAQVVDVITERLLRPQKKKDEESFIDPKPETLVDLAVERFKEGEQKHFKKNFALKQESSESRGFFKKATTDLSSKKKENRVISVQIKGLPKGVTLDEAEKWAGVRNFKANIVEMRIFHSMGITNSGEAFVNFNNEMTAKDYVNHLNGKKNGAFAFLKESHR